MIAITDGHNHPNITFYDEYLANGHNNPSLAINQHNQHHNFTNGHNHHKHIINFSNRDGGAASCPDGDCECASCIASMVSISLNILSILNYNIMNIKQLWWKQGKQKLLKSNLNNNAGDKKRAHLLPEVLRPKQVCLTKSHMFCENIVKNNVFTL